LTFGLFIAAGIYLAAFLPAWRSARAGAPRPVELGIGFVTNFFDTLGIGSFAPTTAMFKIFKVLPDQLIPGTLNVGHLLPTLVQAAYFIRAVEVDPTTLALIIASSTLGAWFGAGVVSGWPRRRIQIGMGIALAVAALALTATNLKWFPAGGDALGLTGWRLAVAVAISAAIGALMTLGIGSYAPTMITVSLLGMNPRAAFPIMMGACAYLMVASSVRFVRAGSFSMRPAVGLLLAGIPAVLVAALIVKEMPLAILRWLVVGVVLTTAAMMLRSAARRE
jgi:uncharacterized membrane protein YfcA